MGVSDRDPLFFPPAKHGDAEEPERPPLEVDTAAQEKRLRAIVLVGAVVMVVALFAVESGPLRSAWDQLLGRPASPARLSDRAVAEILRSPPQRQALRLLADALNHDARAVELIEATAPSWRGALLLDHNLNALVLRALASPDPRTVSAGMEVYLAGYSLAKTPASLDRVASIASADPQHRAWAVSTLGILGNRQVQPDRARQNILAYLHDPDEWTRLGAVDGLGYLGSEDEVAPLLEALHNDASAKVRERAASTLGRKGMLAPEVRRRAVPSLLDFAEDAALDPQTRAWVFAALRDITAQPLPDDAARWRAWHSAQSPGS